ncbi:Putative restriction endonuclease [Sinosporangium album]|uniref:Putative restriction endonuclease n=1 Tax=Sinosporangium album TaxID=504805 RepID=A0A1G8AW02_9ACTN|nr:Uma2 family endonuclease [Sinosporangium album]SDH25212.1 Putative restriction endonuclease [Sinosporangium album]
MHADLNDLHERYQKTCELWSDRRVEIIDGRIVVRELPTIKHSDVVYYLMMQLVPILAERSWKLYMETSLFLSTQMDRYQPDLIVIPDPPRLWDSNHIHADCTLLVTEVVSPSSENDDHVVKPARYSAAGVPLYLVIDPRQGQARLLSHPSSVGYTHETKVRLGEALRLPKPFDLTLETDVFQE